MRFESYVRFIHDYDLQTSIFEVRNSLGAWDPLVDEAGKVVCIQQDISHLSEPRARTLINSIGASLKKCRKFAVGE